MDVTILIDKGFESMSPASGWLRKVVETVLISEHTSPVAEVSLFLTGQDKVHQLNREYLGEDRPTDVLSFPMLTPGNDTAPFVTPLDDAEHLGEVIISLPQAVIQAEDHGHSVQDEIAVLLVHGVLHLLGYDHDIPEAESKMKGREAKILDLVHGL
jgi:probable rRNA maturation factor